MALYQTSALVAAPVDFVFDAWARFDEFPQFLPVVKESRKTGPSTSHWRVVVGGQQAEWDAEIVLWLPNQAIHWRSTSGLRCAGTVSFFTGGRDFQGCRVATLIEYSPPYWLLGNIVDSLGFERGFQRTVQRSLAAFKEKVEADFAASPRAAEFAAAAPRARRR